MSQFIKNLETLKDLRAAATHSLSGKGVSHAAYEEGKEILLGPTGVLDAIFKLQDGAGS